MSRPPRRVGSGPCRAEEEGNDSGQAVVDVAPVRRLPAPVTLATLKAQAALAAFPLVRLPRLSVMPVSDAEWSVIQKLARA